MYRKIVYAILSCFFLQFNSASAQAPTPPAAASDQQLLKAEQLDALVAPIALHPDNLLAEILMASTYPLEVVQADRWATENKNLKGDQLKAALEKQSWDESVKALTATPSVLAMMGKQLDWTQKLGDAVLAQQPDVMDAIQRLRSKAQANGKLTSTKEQKVSVKQEQNKQVIVIEPTNPNTMYVPYYNPSVVYGAWPYPSYPPYYYPPPVGYFPGAALATGLAFTAGVAMGAAWWRGGVGWGNNNITVNRTANINNVGNNWQHNPQHRQGVKYNNVNVQQKFGSNTRAGSEARNDFRGRSGDQVLKPGDRSAGGRPGEGNRAGPGAGNRAGPGAGSKAGPGAGSKGGPGAANKSGPGAGSKGNVATANKGGGKAGPKGGAGPARTGGPQRDNALGNISTGGAAFAQSQRGRSSAGNLNAGARAGGGRPGGGAQAARGGGGRGGGGGRRSDVALKHDIALLGWLDNGLGFYRFSYNGSVTAYVGVMAQEVQAIMPEAVVRGPDGYLRVFYDKLGLTLQTYDRWLASGARLPKVDAVAGPPARAREAVN